MFIRKSPPRNGEYGVSIFVVHFFFISLFLTTLRNMKLCFLVLSFLIIPFTSYGNPESLHLKCSWVDDKIFRGVDDNGSVLPKSPLPDINFQFPKLGTNTRVEVFLPNFMKFERTETFFVITDLLDDKIIVQECLEPHYMTEEEYTRLMKLLDMEVDYSNHLKTSSVCKTLDTKSFNVDRFTGELEVQHWSKYQPSGIFFDTETSKETYLWYQCEKVDRKC